MNTCIQVTAEQIIEKLSKALVNAQIILERNTRELPRLKAAESRLRELTRLVTFASQDSPIFLSLEDVAIIEDYQ